MTFHRFCIVDTTPATRALNSLTGALPVRRDTVKNQLKKHFPDGMLEIAE